MIKNIIYLYIIFRIQYTGLSMSIQDTGLSMSIQDTVLSMSLQDTVLSMSIHYRNVINFNITNSTYLFDIQICFSLQV